MRTIEDRLNALERQARFWRFSTLLALAVSMLGLPWLQGARAQGDGGESKVLRVSRVEIVDAKGKKRAEFGMKEGKPPFLEPQLLLYHSEGENKFAARLAMLGGEPGLSFTDSHADVVTGYYATSDGSAALTMNDHDSDRLVLTHDDLGPRLMLFDTSVAGSEARAEYSLGKAGAALKLFDVNGKYKTGLAAPK